MAVIGEKRIGEYLISWVTIGKLEQNCYSIKHIPSNNQILIDPGEDETAISEALLNENNNLQHILLTHAHYDHVGAVTALCKHHQMSCRVHKKDVRLMHHAPMYAMRFEGRKIESPKPFLELDTDTELKFGTDRIKIIHTPGHTEGGVCFSFNGFIVTGDTLMYQETKSTRLPGSNSDLLVQSIELLLDSVSDDTVILPGHGGLWTIKEAKSWWLETNQRLKRHRSTPN